MANGNVNVSWKTTVIISTSSLCDEASRILLAQHHKIRRSGSILHSSIVFPLSGTAFLLITPEEFPASLEEPELFKRIEKFVQVHRNSFLVLQAPVYGEKEWKILSSLQNRFLGCNLRVIPAHSTADIVKGMLIIAKATSKPSVETLRQQMSMACAHITRNSPIWEVLQKIQL
ncbi:hypothetical protein DNTS_027524 [Danionella cerebrum]|uniref:Uncharacterized protein n=1 Tax=Danionella cerebrum TaxID=2873325 RepID=A0A553R2P1_9TELE|nr:hypothetical protein DNTS_027524 [Danionella translucida]